MVASDDSPPAIRLEDDFSAFQGSEQMFFGLRDPFGMIRADAEASLREQIADTELISVAIEGKPKFLTLGRKSDDGQSVVVAQFGFCARAKLTVLFDERRKGELIEATLTYLFANVDARGSETCRTHFDLHAEAEPNFDDEVFKRRFQAFREHAATTAPPR